MPGWRSPCWCTSACMLKAHLSNRRLAAKSPGPMMMACVAPEPVRRPMLCPTQHSGLPTQHRRLPLQTPPSQSVAANPREPFQAPRLPHVLQHSHHQDSANSLRRGSGKEDFTHMRPCSKGRGLIACSSVKGRRRVLIQSGRSKRTAGVTVSRIGDDTRARGLR